jgi:hypothetical protein
MVTTVDLTLPPLPTHTIPGITIELLDADQGTPLLYQGAKVEQLDAAAKPVGTLFDGRSDGFGKLAFALHVSGPPAGQQPAALPRVQLSIFDLDGDTIQATTLQPDAAKGAIPVKVKMAAQKDKLNGPLDAWSADLSHALSSKLQQALQQLKIDSLATLREKGGQLANAPGLDAAEQKDVILLVAHAHLQLISRDHKINQTLIDKGYPDIIAIADKSPNAFAKSLSPAVPNDKALALHQAAMKALALLNDQAVDRKVALANGRASPKAADATDAPPCDCSCQSAISPLAYLADLLDYGVRHVKSNGSDVDLGFLGSRFYQPFDKLPADCSANETVVREVRLCIEVLRAKVKANGVDGGQGFKDAVSGHVVRAYETLLRELGTARTELRLSRLAQPAIRGALADRVDVDVAFLDVMTLKVGASNAANELNEANLERVFGFLSTARDPLAAVTPSALFDQRAKRLRASWKSEDDQRTIPILDPDVVEQDWIVAATDGDVASGLRQQFSQDLGRLFTALSTGTNNAASLDARLTNGDLINGALTVFHGLGLDLPTLTQRRDAGQGYGDALLGKAVRAPELDALLAVRDLARNNQAEADDWDAIYNILTAIEKRTWLYNGWRNQEKAKGLTLSPQSFVWPSDIFAISVPTEPRSAAFMQWRFDTVARRDWRDTLVMRQDQQASVGNMLGAAVGEVEEEVLPQLRDAIVALAVPGTIPLADKKDWITNDLLINASQSGCCQTTRVAQAIETVQLLLWGIRARQFEDQKLTLDADLDKFDDEWKWLGSYAAWRAAMFVFLYPEDFLDPSLKRDGSAVYGVMLKLISGALTLQDQPAGATNGDTSGEALIESKVIDVIRRYVRSNIELATFEGMRSIFPLLPTIRFFTADVGAEPTVEFGPYPGGAFFQPTIYLDEIGQTPAHWTDPQYELEDLYYLPMHCVLTLRRQGNFTNALDALQWLCDFPRISINGRVDQLLRQRVNSSEVVRNDQWLGDPLNPVAIAAGRIGGDQRFILVTAARCHLDYAESEFARDADSLPHARELFLTAERILNSDSLGKTESCDVGLQSLVIDIGEPHYRTFVLSLLQGLLDAGRYDNLSKQARVDLIAAIKTAARPAGPSRPGSQTREVIRQAITKAFPAQPAVSFQRKLDDARKTRRAILLPLLKEEGRFEIVQQAVGGHSSTARTAAMLLRYPNKGVGVRGDTITIVSEPPSFTFCVPQNPIVAALRLRATVGLFKLDNCLNSAGMPRPNEVYAAPSYAPFGAPTPSGAGQLVASSARMLQPTQYRYKTLIERARQLVAIAQQMENAYLNFLEHFDAETYNEMLAEQQLGVANATVRLQDLRVTEAGDGQDLADLQWNRANTSFQYFDGLIQGGVSDLEQESLDQLDNAHTLQGAAALIQGTYGSVLASGSSGLTGWDQLAGAASSTAAAAATASQIASMRASFERRAEEWGFQKSLASIDMSIAQQQQTLAQDHYNITQQERAIANITADNAGTGVAFLRNKFTSAELYQWMSGVVGGAYRYFLQEATAIAKLAQAQLAFERQEQPFGLIADDYWMYPATNGSASTDATPDRRGLTGSARLLEDISKLDEYAFATDQRKLQLSKNISLAQFDPYAFARFCQTGVLQFATSLDQFDRDFPGQYLRLIKRVRVSVVALIPPTEGVKATLATTGISRVVISQQGGTQFSELGINHAPEIVALTSPLNASGVFDMVEQPEMLLPFEGSGVAAQWTFELPRAANAIDFANIADVLITIDYTALYSPPYRQQVIQSLDPSIRADRAYSLRYDFADVWYDLHNPDQVADAQYQMKAALDVRASDFPPNLVRLAATYAKVPDVTIQQVRFYVVRKDGELFELPVGLKFKPTNVAQIDGGTATTKNGLISTRQSSGNPWRSVIGNLPVGKWEFDLTGTMSDAQGQPLADSIRKAFEQDLIDDILFIVSYQGQTPPFPT